MFGWTIQLITLLFFVTLRAVAGRFLPRPRRTTAVTLTLILLVIAGAYLTVSSSKTLIKSNERKHWSVAEGKVIKSQREIKGIVLPMVIYAYEVDGRAYVDTTNLQVPGFGNAAKQNQVTEELLREYPVGKTIQVHYNPEDVTESVLITRPQWNIYGKMGLGVFLFGIALFFLLLPVPEKK